MYKVCLTAFFISLTACQKTVNLNFKSKTIRWSANSNDRKPNLEDLNFNYSQDHIKILGEVVERSQQKIGGATVEGSFLQRVYNADGNLQFVTGNQELPNISDNSNNSELEKKAEKLNSLKSKVIEIVKRSYSPLRQAAFIFKPETIIVLENNHPHFFWKVEFIAEDNSTVYSLRINPDFTIASSKKVESCFEEKMSMVFPFGPKLSELQNELLKGLIGDGTLSNQKFKLTSNDGLSVKEENGAFTFDPNDDRFDQVQSYFFIQKTLDFAEKFWHFNLVVPLQVQLRAGYPEKSNIAFYYRGQVRLGDGDGITYQQIPRDPSIVSHEVMHSVIEALSGMATEGEAGSLNEGFADFLTAAVWDNPWMGHTAYKKALYKRTVENAITLAEKNGGLYHDSGILSGTFWEIKSNIGSEKAQQLALKTLLRLGSQPQFADLRPAINDSLKSLAWSETDVNKVQEILSTRGW